MSIPEAQFDVWAKQGSVTQSRATYGTIRNHLEASDAPYANRSFSIFLQGSYGNDTNIYADSDVDAVIALDDLYYQDLSQLSDAEKAAFDRSRSGAGYTYDDFKAAVVKHLVAKFGSAVKPGKKAIFIAGNDSRRDVDVLAAAEIRRITRFVSPVDQDYHVGICFWTTDGRRIINFPRQHSTNCTTKHQDTASWFKPTVRIFKNMRNHLTNHGLLAVGVAPSYFLEGMLWNVPNNQFGVSYQQTVSNCLNWLYTCDKSQLACANDLYWLCRAGGDVTWTEQAMSTFLDAAIDLWNSW